MLRQQEVLALELIFRDESILSRSIREQLAEAKGVNWEETGVGFYSTIKLGSPLKEMPNIRMWEFNFNHPDFPYGGSFMCTIVKECELELEAVTLGGANWPNPTDLTSFEEIR